VRSKGKFSLMEAGYGPDTADPVGTMDPFLSTAMANRYSSVFLASALKGPDGSNIFEKKIAEADGETRDLRKRYEMFAEAEKILLDNALLIPFYVTGGGYRASYVHPFSSLTAQWGRFGMTKPKGIVLLDKPIGMDDFPAAQAQYEKERQEALKNRE
jgi:oligopeptide transport system substrate-binding protein